MYQVCSHCAVALVNGDLSGLEFCGKDLERIEARIETMGLVTMTESIDPGWFFDCYVCEENCSGAICMFEPV